MNVIRKESWNQAVIPAIAVLNIWFHLAFSANLGYHRDELLYFSLGQHPAAGYETVPPLIGLSAWIIQSLFGYSVYAVRLIPALFSGIMIFIVAAIARELGGSRYAEFLSAAGLTISIFFMRSFSLFQPVFIEIFLWTLCIYFLIRYINTKKNSLLIIFGLTSGIALLNKYLVILLFAGLLIIIPFTSYRFIFRNRIFWYGVILGFIVFSPNFFWQVSKGFPVFNHMSELYETQLVHMDVSLFLSEQIIMPFAGTVFTVAGLVNLLFSKHAEKFRFLGFLSLFIIIGLMVLKGKSYYTLGIFPVLIAAGAVSYDRWIKNRLLRILIPLALIVVTIPVIPIGIPVFKSDRLIAYFDKLDRKYGIDLGRRFEDGSVHSLPQDYADMLGWNELTAIVADTYNGIKDKRSCFIYCENYGQAGAITIIGKKYGLPEAVSFHESFKYWYPKSFDPDIISLIYINNDQPGEDVMTLFNKVTKRGSITNPDAREYGTSVYLFEEPVASFNSFWIKRTESLNKAD